MAFPKVGCGCGCGGSGAPPCIQCVPVTTGVAHGNDGSFQTVVSFDIPANTWNDGEMFVLDYCLRIVAGGSTNLPRSGFRVLGGVQGNLFGFSGNQAMQGGTTLQWFRTIIRRIDTHVGIYDGDRLVSRTDNLAQDDLGYQSIIQSIVFAPDNGQDYQSPAGANGVDPDFTLDCPVVIVIHPQAGGDARDSVTGLSCACYKYTVPALPPP